MAARAALPALTAALLFGASTPLAKLLLGGGGGGGAALQPLLLAGLLYLGSGIGLGLLLVLRRWRERATGHAVTPLAVPRSERPWLLGAIVFGGMLGPALLMLGLSHTGAASASLLLNGEAVLTALIAWLVFKENADQQVVLGMLAIVAGGVLLAWQPGAGALSMGAVFIVAACLCWAIDNNLTRKVSSNDAMCIAGLKGLVAGACNTGLALATGASWPAAGTVGGSLLVGFFGYGLSLTLFVVALRTLGTARTGAYFSVAPLFGVLLSLALWPALPGLTFWLAAACMALGVWLHVRERHAHTHTHEVLEHAHAHSHDAHHQHAHAHDSGWDGVEPHVHPHRHAVMTHKHPHYPDIHHRHRH